MVLFLDSKRLAANDQAASAATTQGVVDDISTQWAEATAPTPPSFSLASLGSFGVSDAPSPIMSAIGALPQIGQKAQQMGQQAISWALPSLESQGVSRSSASAGGPEVAYEQNGTSRRDINVAAMPQGAPDALPNQITSAAQGQPAPATSSGVPSGPPGSRQEKQAIAYQESLASGLDQEGAQILVAVTETEGGLEGAIGDHGRSRGGYQFYEGGQMPGFRAWVRSQGIQGDPDTLVHDIRLATRFAATTYLGAAIRAGRTAGLSGSALATYVQRHGQVSENPEKTGENYERLFGSGRPAPNAGVASSPPAAPPAAAQAPAQPAPSAGDLATIENVDSGLQRQVPREQVPSWLRPVAPGMGPSWRVVGGPVASALDAARSQTGGGETMARQSLGQPADDPGADGAIPDDTAIASVSGLPPAGGPQRQEITWGPDRVIHETGVEARHMGMPADEQYDPDSGPREAIPGSEGAANLTPLGPELPPVSAADAEEQAGYAAQQQEAEPPASPWPTMPGLQPILDAGGKVVAWVQAQQQEAASPSEPIVPPASPYAPGQAESMTPPPAHQMRPGGRTVVQSTPGEADYLPPPGPTLGVYGEGGLLEPMGGLPRIHERIGQIEDNAVREVGSRGTSDPMWRARNPEAADEYDALQQQLGLGVAGQVGDASRFGRAARPTVEVIQEQLDAARQVVQRARDAGDVVAERAANDQAWSLTDQLADAVNARRAAEPAITSDVGRRADTLPLTEETADALTDAQRATERVRTDPADLSGPVSVPVSMAGRQNAGLPFDPASAAAGGAAGAMSEDEEGNQGDPMRTAAGVFLGRMAGGMGRRRGPVQRGLPSVVINGKVVRASSSKPPNLLEIGQAYRHSIGMLGQVGTGLMNAMGGPVSAGSALATDVIRTGLMKGYPVPAIMEAGSLVTGLGEATRDMLGTALGFIPQRVRNAPDFRPPLAERMQGPVGKALGWTIDTPGRLATQTPDAFFGSLFERLGRRRAANELMQENGVGRLDVAGQVEEIGRLLNNPTPDEAAKIEASARAFSDEMTYKGPAGYWEEALSGPFRAKGGPTTANSPVTHQIHDLVGSFLMPFYSSIFKIHKLAATHVPGLGFVADTGKPMSERISRQLVGIGFGLWVADRAAQGLVTGPGPDDPDEKARLKATGWDEWSTYLPGVGYVKSDNLAQAAPMLKMIGAYYDSQRYPTKNVSGDPLKDGEAVVKKIMRSFEGFPVLRTFSDLYKAAEKPIEGGADMAINAASSLVPAVVRANESSKDPYQRTADFNAPIAERIRQRALNRVGSIPGVGSRQDSPPQLDRKGEPIPNPRFGANPLLPAPARQPKTEDPIVAEMSQYGIDLDKPRDRFAFTRSGADSPDGASGSVRVTLKPEWQQEWLQARWQKVQEDAATAQADPRYGVASGGVRRNVWNNVIRQAETYADRVVKSTHRQEIEQMIRDAPVVDPLPIRRAS